jgi:hypothetical protein
MTKRETPKSERNKSLSEQTESSPELDAAARALFELFSDSKLNSRRHFRYSVDGHPSELDQAFDAALNEHFGPNKKQERWVRRLRRLGLINDRQDKE